MTAPNEAPRVTQAARDAAARHLGYADWQGFYQSNLPLLRRGCDLAEAFWHFEAEIRAQAEAAAKAEKAELVEALRMMLEYSEPIGPAGDHFADMARALLAKHGGAS